MGTKPSFEVSSLVDLVRSFLQQSIVTGEFEPGQQIKEEEVAVKLNISRPPVREGFKLLEAEGLVTRRPRKGVFVSEITEKDVWEIYTLKSVIYGLASRLAVNNLSERQIKNLEKTYRRMEECVSKEPPDITKYQELNDTFHFITIDSASHERLKKVVLSLNNQIHRFSYKSLSDREYLLSSLDYHRKILCAIRDRKAEEAETLTREHVLRGLHRQKNESHFKQI
ncbi:MAG: GntR family transcriptional regulator [Desulfobacteraceae bacterium]|nr:MAG: GntR family transcriptional regulator [Desulfobacteraceae bacterium]